MIVEKDSADCIKVAKEKIYSKQYDLVITDFNLPDGNGPQLVSEYKRDHPWSNLPLFALSSAHDELYLEKEVPNLHEFF